MARSDFVERQRYTGLHLSACLYFFSISQISPQYRQCCLKLNSREDLQSFHGGFSEIFCCLYLPKLDLEEYLDTFFVIRNCQVWVFYQLFLHLDVQVISMFATCIYKGSYSAESFVFLQPFHFLFTFFFIFELENTFYIHSSFTECIQHLLL